MSRDDIMSGVATIMREYFDDEDLEITPATTANDIPAWDSLNHINIMVAVEQTFKVRFLTSEVEHLHNVGDLINLIEKKTAGR